MTETNHWKLGLFIVTGITVILGTAAWFGFDRLRRDYRVAFAYFNEPVNGLSIGSPVKFLGVLIGEVVDIQGGPGEYVDYVMVEAHLYLDALERMGLYDPTSPRLPGEEPFVRRDLRVQLVSSPLTGVTFIQSAIFDLDAIPSGNLPFPTSWNTVRTVSSTLEILEKELMETLRSLPPLADQARRMMATVESSLLDLDLRDLSQRTRNLLATAEERIGTLDTRGLSRDARDAMAEVRGFVAELRNEDGAVQSIVSRFDALAGSLERALEEADLQATAKELRSAGSSVGRAGDQFAAFGRDLRGDVDLLRETLDSVRRLAVLLERDPGSLLYGRSPRSPVRRNP